MKQIIVLLLILISVPSFGQYEKLFSDKNIAPYNLALKDKFIWKDSLVHRDSLTYAEITTDSIRFRYFDGSYTDWLKFDLNYFTNADETDPIYAGDSANIVWFDDLDYFTNADETDPIFDAHLASNITTSDTTKWGAGYTHSLLTSGNPHSVTATNVGLGNVENAAASGLYEPIFSKNTGFNKNFGSFGLFKKSVIILISFSLNSEIFFFSSNFKILQRALEIAQETPLI